WALGATLYTLVSGRIVHEAENASEILVHAATRPARPLADVAPEVPAALRAVIDRALAFEKAARWAGAAEMDAALGAACREALGVEVEGLARVTAPAQEEKEGEDLGAPSMAPREEAPAKPFTSRNVHVGVTRTMPIEGP